VDEVLAFQVSVAVFVLLDVLVVVKLGMEPDVTVRVTGTETLPPWAAVIVTLAV